MQEAEVDPGARRARLDEELQTMQREARRLGRRVEMLDRERAARVALVKTLEVEVARTAESRSFRYGHGILRRLSRWLRRRPARRTGLDSAAALLEEARWELARPRLPDSPVARSPSPPRRSGNPSLRRRSATSLS
ncbi:MAG: hypothetical protein WA687_06185, partial [Solirubrobacterales bacterium]